MGLKPSSDIFNINSDKAVRGLPGCLKSVDDILTQAKSYPELKSRLIKLFGRFERYNIKIKPSKLRIGRRVCFGGFEVGLMTAFIVSNVTFTRIYLLLWSYKN